MRRVLRSMTIGVLVLALCVDPATACHFLRARWGGGWGGWSGGYCAAPVEYAGPCRGVVIASDGCCSYQGHGHGVYVNDRCCGSGVVIDDGAPIYHGEAIYEGEEVDSLPIESERVEPTPSETYRPMDDQEAAPALPADPMPPPRPTEDDELLTPPPREAQPPTAPVEPLPTQAPPTEADPAPSTSPMDDLFGPTTEPETPATSPATTPAESDPMDDFFFDGPTDTTEGDAPAQDVAPPVESFDAPPTEAEPPATEPSEPGEDDLFGGFSAPETGEPTTPTPEPAADDDFGDFGVEDFDFNEEITPPADEPAPETEETPVDDTESLFDFSMILQEPGGLSSDELRTWVDNTGKYSCNARLVQFLDGNVRLLKDNGRTTTLPLYRLSKSDLEFVHRQASAQQVEVLGRTAQATSHLPWAN